MLNMIPATDLVEPSSRNIILVYTHLYHFADQPTQPKPTKMRECISVHVGQAGVQMGNACWELYCLEHGWFSFFLENLLMLSF